MHIFTHSCVQGKVTVTISRGRVVWADGRLNVTRGSGRFIPRPTHGPLYEVGGPSLKGQGMSEHSLEQCACNSLLCFYAGVSNVQ